MVNNKKLAVHLHSNIPPDWYYRSIKNNLFQRFWHNQRFKQVAKVTSKADVVLDIGCADGTFTKILLEATQASKVVGIDVLKSSINYSRKRFTKDKRFKFMVADAHNLPFKNQVFDAIFCLEALEHVIDPLTVIQEMHKVLRKDGYLIILVPSENLLFRIIWKLWQKVPGKNVWQHTHLHNFSNGFIEELLNKSGFKIVKNNYFLLGMLHLIKAIKNTN